MVSTARQAVDSRTGAALDVAGRWQASRQMPMLEVRRGWRAAQALILFCAVLQGACYLRCQAGFQANTRSKCDVQRKRPSGIVAPSAEEPRAAPRGIGPDTDAIGIVREFCRMDAEALRLDGRFSRPLWDLTAGEGEPPDWPVSVISAYRGHPAKVSGTAAAVTVDYDVIGSVGDEPFEVQPRKKTERATFYLTRTAFGWRIDVSRLRVSPHVLAGPLVRYFEGLLADTPPEMPDRRKMLERTIGALRTMSARRGVRRP